MMSGQVSMSQELPRTIASEPIVRVEVFEGSYTNAASENSRVTDIRAVAGIASGAPTEIAPEEVTTDGFRFAQGIKSGSVSAFLYSPEVEFSVYDEPEVQGLYIAYVVTSEAEVSMAVHDLLDNSERGRRIRTFSGRLALEAAVTTLQGVAEVSQRPGVARKMLDGIILAVNYLHEPVRGAID